MSFRLIPCLLLSNDGLVKSTNFKNNKYVGDPINAIKIFNEKEVDELILLDIDATSQKRAPNFALIEQIAGECFMPLCYGGGITNFSQVKMLFDIGVEKVSIQSAILTSPDLIKDIAATYGEQAVVASIDIKKSWLGKNKVHSHAGIKNTPDDWQAHLLRCVNSGAGEILLTSVDRDGMGSGMDLSLITEASALVGVPITAMGGVGSLDHVKAAKAAGASAVAAGSFFVFQGPHKAVLITYPKQQELLSL